MLRLSHHSSFYIFITIGSIIGLRLILLNRNLAKSSFILILAVSNQFIVVENLRASRAGIAVHRFIRFPGLYKAAGCNIRAGQYHSFFNADGQQRSDRLLTDVGDKKNNVADVADANRHKNLPDGTVPLITAVFVKLKDGPISEIRYDPPLYRHQLRFPLAALSILPCIGIKFQFCRHHQRYLCRRGGYMHFD